MVHGEAQRVRAWALDQGLRRRAGARPPTHHELPIPHQLSGGRRRARWIVRWRLCPNPKSPAARRGRPRRLDRDGRGRDGRADRRHLEALRASMVCISRNLEPFSGHARDRIDVFGRKAVEIQIGRGVFDRMRHPPMRAGYSARNRYQAPIARATGSCRSAVSSPCPYGRPPGYAFKAHGCVADVGRPAAADPGRRVISSRALRCAVCAIARIDWSVGGRRHRAAGGRAGEPVLGAREEVVRGPRQLTMRYCQAGNAVPVETNGETRFRCAQAGTVAIVGESRLQQVELAKEVLMGP